MNFNENPLQNIVCQQMFAPKYFCHDEAKSSQILFNLLKCLYVSSELQMTGDVWGNASNIYFIFDICVYLCK